MVQKTGYQIDPDFNFFTYFDYYISLKIKGNLKIILLYLVKCHGPDGLINPSQKDMAEKCGMNLTLLKDNIKRLEALGYIKRHRTGRSCYYFVAKPDRPETGLSNRPENRLSHRPENGPALLKENKDKDKDKEEMLPQGISFENYFKNLPSGIAGNIQKKTVEFYWENGFKDDLIRAAAGMESWPEKDRIKAFQTIINGFKRKLPMKNEQINIDQKAEYDIVWADAAKNNGNILKNIGTRL